MTDRLSTLMHAEVDALDVPRAPAPEILEAGRQIRQRTWGLRAGAVVLTAAVVVMAAAIVAQGRDPETVPPPAVDPSSPPVAAPPVPTAYAVDDTVYFGDGTTVQMPEIAQTLYYTSAGILVRTNRNGYSDGGAPFHFELVDADGKATKLGVTLGDVAPSADPTEPYLAWATMAGGQIQVVVHDVATDQDVATVDVPGAFSWGGWDAPPVALSGDLVYVGTDDKTTVVNWRTGAATTSDAVPGSLFPEVHGRYALIDGNSSTRVVATDTGNTVLDVPKSLEDPPALLSPDGHHVLVGTQGHTEIYDVASGTSFQVASGDWGFTATGDQVFRVAGSTMTTCSTTSGQCHEASVPQLAKDAFVRYAGIAFES